MNTSLARAACASLLSACPVFAQTFLPLGTEVALADDDSVNTVDLGFNFAMPGGAIVSQVDIDTHGRIVEVGSDASDDTESTGELTGNATGSINVCWDRVSYRTDPNASIYFDTDGATRAVVTWVNISQDGVYTMQCQLHADGRIAMLYDSRMPDDDGLVGVCPGNGATLPAESDLSTAVAANLVSSDATVFEDFGFTVGVSTSDLQSTALEFVPNGTGGAGGWTVIGTGGIADPEHFFANNRAIAGGGCFVPVTYSYVPNGEGGYDVTAGPSLFDPVLGSLAGATDDDDITAVGLDLGFAMPFPDGSLVQFVDVDPNGRIVPTTLAGTEGDFSPSIGDITGDGYPYFFGWWTDWNVEEPTSDGIYFRTAPGVATFTWNNVAQFGINPVPTCTWQIKLFDDGSVQITHQDMLDFNPAIIGNSADDAAVGLTTGAVPDPGEIDHSSLTSTPTIVSGYAYEFWDASGSAPAEPVDLLFDGARMAGLTEPFLGANWTLQIQGSGAALFGFYVIGFGTGNANLAFLGSPCTLVVTADVLDLQTTNGLGDLNPFVLPIPADPALASVELFVQGAYQQPIAPPFGGFVGLPFAFAFTNGIRGIIGEL